MSKSRCCGPVTRREFMQVGALALGGLSLEEVLAAQDSAGNTKKENSIILLYLHGGPSQLETYDLKPDAPSEYRSVFQPISTNIAGIDICEHFPLQAKIADKFSLVRSLHHDVGIHSDGGIIVLTGKRPTVLDPTSQSVGEHPDFGSIASQQCGLHRDAMPRFVTIPGKFYMTRSAYLGVQHSPFEIGDPSSKYYKPPLVQLSVGKDGREINNRRSLLKSLDRFRGDLDVAGNLESVGKFRELAFRMLSSSRVSRAFDLSLEDDKLRDRYGRHLWGQGCLLARRLAEAGTSVVSLFINTPKSGQEFTNWDDHPANAGRPGHFGKFMQTRLPYLDQALAGLIEDIYQRSLDEKIMVVVMGEFGRTPRLRSDSIGTGRDHWPNAYSALISGGGFRMGQVIGATNSKSEYPIKSPYTPQDLLATMYRHLGINYHHNLTDYSGRPVPILPSGRPIRELL